MFALRLALFQILRAYFVVVCGEEQGFELVRVEEFG